MGADQPVHRCPECGSEAVLPTAKTVKFLYCRCETCGTLWHEERSAPPSTSGPKRRHTDGG